MDEAARARRDLVALLRRAHAGERAAFHAYAGHWRAVTAPDEREAIQRIAAEEVAHRAGVREMLAVLGAAPAPWREVAMLAVGVCIGLLCRLGRLAGPLGWYAAMDGAGRLEAGNVGEYVTAARLAHAAGASLLAPALLHMAAVEHAHEAWFHARCASHPLSRWAPGWRRPLPLPAP